MSFPWQLILFILGLLYRVSFLFLYPQPIAMDQEQYVIIANRILDYRLYVHSFRVYGYSLFLAVISFFSKTISDNPLLVWQIAQMLLDTVTAFIIFLTARRLFTKTIAWVVCLIYLFCPFTAAASTVILPEALASFIIISLHYIFLNMVRKINLPVVILSGLLLGFLPQVRPALVFYSVVVLLFFIFYFLKLSNLKKMKTGVVMMLLVAYSIPFAYNVIGNYRYFGELAFLEVDNLFIQNFYVSLFVEKSPQTITSVWDYPPEVTWAYSYYTTGQTPAERKEIRKLFVDLIIAKIKKDPYQFVSWRIKKLWYVWEKHELFPFNNPDNQFVMKFLYWLNVGYLTSAVVGLVFFAKRALKSVNKNNLIFLVLSLFLPTYITFSNAFTVAGGRYSLPAYPLLLLYSGVGVVVVWQYLTKKLFPRES